MKVGPPLPPGFAIPKLPSKPAVTAEKKKVATKVDDDDSDSSGDEEEEEVNLCFIVDMTLFL